jgi:hypothetical protein
MHPGTLHLRLVAATAAISLAAAGLVPALASADPTVTADLGCYTPGQTMALGAGGFTPNDDVAFFMALSGPHGSGLLYTDPFKSDATGAVTTELAAPKLASDSDTQETVDLSAVDETLIGSAPVSTPPPGSFADTEFLLSGFGARVDAWQNGRGDPRRSARVRVIGWEPSHVVWAHYFLNGKRVRSIRIGTVSGPCGDLTKTIRQFPFHPVKAGTWVVYFSPSQVFDRNGMWARSKRIVVPKSKAVG